MLPCVVLAGFPRPVQAPLAVEGTVGEVADCTWCGSAGSIEHGMCQVCLMPYPEEHIELPDPDDPRAPREPRVVLSREEELPPASAETA